MDSRGVVLCCPFFMGRGDFFVKEFFGKLGFDSHHKMERFGVLFGFLLLGLVITTGVSFREYLKQLNIKLGNDAIYTESFTSSISGVNGKVRGVYTNKDKTRALLLVKFEDPSLVSLDAKDYQAYVSAKGQTRQVSPKGAIYSFGSTGYLGVYLSDVDGFPTQVLDITVRHNANLGGDMGTVNPEEMDASFAKHDQFRIYCNPGASKATHLAALDSEQLSISDIYKETVGDFEEEEIREKLNDSLALMQQNLAKRDEYGRRLTAQGMVLPEEPQYMQGDTVTESEDGVLSLHTQTVFPGGYDFDWQSKQIADGGYLDSLKEREMGETDEKMFARMGNLVNTTDTALLTTLSDAWFRQDGSEFDPYLSDLLPTDETIVSLIGDYEAAQSEYLSTKLAYQQTQLRELLYLEYLSGEQDSQFTVNSEDQAIILWDQI